MPNCVSCAKFRPSDSGAAPATVALSGLDGMPPETTAPALLNWIEPLLLVSPVALPSNVAVQFH